MIQDRPQHAHLDDFLFPAKILPSSNPCSRVDAPVEASLDRFELVTLLRNHWQPIPEMLGNFPPKSDSPYRISNPFIHWPISSPLVVASPTREIAWRILKITSPISEISGEILLVASPFPKIGEQISGIDSPIGLIGGEIFEIGGPILKICEPLQLVSSRIKTIIAATCTSTAAFLVNPAQPSRRDLAIL